MLQKLSLKCEIGFVIYIYIFFSSVPFGLLSIKKSSTTHKWQVCFHSFLLPSFIRMRTRNFLMKCSFCLLMQHPNTIASHWKRHRFFNGDKISTGCVLCTERVKGNPPFAFMDFSSFHLKWNVPFFRTLTRKKKSKKKKQIRFDC